MMLPFLALLVPTLSPQTASPANQGRDGPFQAVVLSVPDLEQFDREWQVKTEGAQVTSTQNLTRNKFTYVVVLFGGCQTNNVGKCRIEVSHRVTAPDGKPYDGLDGKRAVPADDIPVARVDAFFLAPQLLGIRIEPGEALGPYKFDVTVNDVFGKRRVTTSQVLTAVEAD